MRWLRRRPRRTIECETCGRALTRRRAVIVEHFFATYDGPGLITATYCRPHSKEHTDAQ